MVRVDRTLENPEISWDEKDDLDNREITWDFFWKSAMNPDGGRRMTQKLEFSRFLCHDKNTELR